MTMAGQMKPTSDAYRTGKCCFAASEICGDLVGGVSGQNYTFGDWARDQGYSPGDVVPEGFFAAWASIDSLDGIGGFDWTTTPTTGLALHTHRRSSIEPGAFSGLTNLTGLYLGDNKLSSIESGTRNSKPRINSILTTIGAASPGNVSSPRRVCASAPAKYAD
jgi:hypothetical protein